ncbi:MAG TPA: glycosyltransferase [Stellaceae bacterium]
MTGIRRQHKRVLIYSHDSFGLGHLRRCRTIAHSLVDADRDLSVLILSGSPIIGSFDFRARVDFVRIPGVIKLRNGEYTSLSLHMRIEETLGLRASIIRHTADIFDPDLLIVDKEPLGLRGEVRGTLEMLRRRGVPAVLGLRDVLDEPAQLAPEWARKNVLPALQRYYDDIWIYGLPQICNPLDGIGLPPSVQKRIAYTGYLRRTVPSALLGGAVPGGIEDGEPFLLVTPGGGGDGEALVDWVLAAYEADTALPHRALVVLGPFMQPERRAEFQARAARLGDGRRVHAIIFDAHLETLMARASGVVAMGGYNTFCEILSFDKPALLVPRTAPRREQYIRASRAAELGLVSMLEDDGERDPLRMAAALRQLPQQPVPSRTVVPGLLDGLQSVNRLARKWLDQGVPRPKAVAGIGRSPQS